MNSWLRFATILLLGVPPIVGAQVSSQSTVSPSTMQAPADDSASSQDGVQADTEGKRRPNILFIIMDDVGIDQMQIFGYGGLTPPLTPNINAIARAGVRFRNAWSMPECSPSRAIFFEGRYPLRTGVYNAILSTDLANSQVSPYEATTPKILKRRGYESALFGKFHLAGPDYNPFGRATPFALGWDYFDGFLEGATYPIDPTIGHQFTDRSLYTCGFIPNTSKSPNGADTGACRHPDNHCDVISRDAAHPTPGFSCLQEGGLFVPKTTCDAPAPALDFAQTNAYYVWKRVINQPDGTVIPSDPNAVTRGYVSDTTTSAAVDWINRKNAANKHWMTTVSYANDHTPYQQPPRSLLPSPTPDTSGFSCTGNDPKNVLATRVISNQMIEAMDTEIGNLLVNSGLASRSANGQLDYHPERTNTMVVIIGDNGTYAPGVKVPFDLSRSKGTVYQTGVWVPLIVSGPMVVSPGREVKQMVNVTDLFQLWGDVAGIDVHKAVPKSHILDSQPMLPYLTEDDHPSIRKTNFTQTGNNIHLNDVQPPPCVLALTSPPTCVQLFTSPQLCAFEGGDWYGPTTPDGTSPPNPVYATCCDVQRAGIYKDQNGVPVNLSLLPVFQVSTRNDDFKLVRKQIHVCASAPSTNDTRAIQTEFYRINEKAPLPKIDKAGDTLCGEDCPAGLKGKELETFNYLQADMDATLSSEPPCPGDGNEDKKVNFADIKDWYLFTVHNGGSSWYDFNHDGHTDIKDLDFIGAHLGTNCLRPKP